MTLRLRVRLVPVPEVRKVHPQHQQQRDRQRSSTTLISFEASVIGCMKTNKTGHGTETLCTSKKSGMDYRHTLTPSHKSSARREQNTQLTLTSLKVCLIIQFAWHCIHALKAMFSEQPGSFWSGMSHNLVGSGLHHVCLTDKRCALSEAEYKTLEEITVLWLSLGIKFSFGLQYVSYK